MKYKMFFVFILFIGSLQSDCFTALTYNILCEEFACEEIYDYVKKEDLCWNNRKERIIERLRALNSDVICLQEVNEQTFKALQQGLTEYEGSLACKGKDAIKTNVGICTFCKKGVFKNISHKSCVCDGSSRCGKHPVRPALFTDVTLQNGSIVTIINTKVRYSSSVKEKDGIWNHVHYLIDKMPKESVLVIGDFNRTPDHFLIKEIIDCGLQDIFAKENRPTCYANKKVKRIDYIFASKDMIVTPLSCSFLTGKEPIPSQNEPSDHIPILCHVMK